MTELILTSPQELEGWLDEFMAEKMEELHIPGVTFSLVQNGELFFCQRLWLCQFRTADTSCCRQHSVSSRLYF